MGKGKYLIAIGIALSIICSAYLLSLGIRHFSGGDPVVRVTGVSERNITSDLAVLNITIKQRASTQVAAYETLQKARQQTESFLKTLGLDQGEVKQGSITIIKGLGDRPIQKDYYYNADKHFNGYELQQTLLVSSSKVNQIEMLPSSIGQLISQGIDVEVSEVAYYYTKLDDLKVEMLKEASANALSRATIIAEGGQSKLGKLKGASMGVFQVVGKNNTEDQYSWGGTLNTKSKEKTASVTVKNTYILE